MKLGVAYYPEYNKHEKWLEHMKLVKEAGIRRIRMAEFAWSLIQPEKDVFNWAWLDESLELAASLSLEVILGTPTACPPIWLVDEYPEVLPVNREGRRSGFGARQHRCYNSPAYIEYSAKIVEAMAQRYGRHIAVAAWQIDNELGGEQKRCYCGNCHKAFQQYLAGRYQTIEQLNERWGNHFWSQDYQKWSQIPVPMRFASDMDMKHHPSLELEFTRFSSESIVNFCNLQADILRKYTDKPITTNTDTFLFGDNVNISELFKNLDIGGMDIYSENLHEISFYSDITRSLKKDRFWMMEFGTGSPNLHNQMELIEKAGCEWFLLFTFKPFAAGQEQGFKGLVSMTGQPEPNYYVVKQWADEHDTDKKGTIVYDTDKSAAIIFDTGAHDVADKHVASECDADICDTDEVDFDEVDFDGLNMNASRKGFTMPEVGLFYNFDSSWAYWLNTWANNIIDKNAYPKYMINTLYKSLFEEHVPVQFAFDASTIIDFKTLIMPWQIIYYPDLEQKLIEFVENGGHLIVTSDLFRKNADNVFLEEIPTIYRKLLDWHEDNFFDESNLGDNSVIRTAKSGKGQTWMVRRLASTSEWKALINKIIR